MNKNQKAELVSSLKDQLTNSVFVAVVHYRGMSDKQIYDMRVALKSKSCGMKIAKNTLIRVAIKGTDLEALTPHLKGPTAILYSQDLIALSKVISDFAKEIEVLKIKIGYLNKELITENTINDLAKLGSLEEVRASFIGKLKGIQSNFVRILNAPESGLASSFKS
ncbi:MAG: 50S ribosomal protein L10 [Proteobacteria bacterium]|nr:50S ribosomal protein L10 [Pseudomonadota bacterium]